MNIRAIAAYSQQITHVGTVEQRKPQRPMAEQPPEQRPTLPLPVAVEVFTQQAQMRRIALGTYLDKRV
ncbi:MAG: hypothetical protein RMK00_06860 [Bacteroidota bacterium]|nr:hypothetical protein [Candidatus Kapabacteria bacterium]MDW8075476.1 hypothetical protein [Bacteroidota bacterium]